MLLRPLLAALSLCAATFVTAATVRETGNSLPLVAARAIIRQHNLCRAAENVGLKGVKWDKNLAISAEAYAEALALDRGCTISHSDDAYRENINGWVNELAGENLMWGENTVWHGSMVDIMEVAVESPKIWCQEKRFYNMDTLKCRPGKECGHYTQMVWHDSRTIGCGLAFCPLRPTAAILACHYQPGGNYVGQPPFSRPTTTTTTTAAPLRKRRRPQFALQAAAFNSYNQRRLWRRRNLYQQQNNAFAREVPGHRAMNQQQNPFRRHWTNVYAPHMRFV